METVDLRKCFPVMNGGDGVMLSKRGDITVGWELELPPAFRCNEEKYDSLVATLRSAVTLLPDWSIVHKQDVFMRKRYSREEMCDFLSQSYEGHFDGRSYLDHRCRIYVTFSNKKAIHGGSSGLLGLTETGLPKPDAIGRCLGAADQFEAIVRSNELLSLHRLSDAEIFGTESIPGIVQDYLNFTDEGADELSDLQLANDRLRTGDKFISCHLISDLDQLPGEIASCRRVAALSTENSAVNLSYFNEIGQGLDCEHIVNQFILKEPLKDIHGELDSKRKRMTSMSTKSAENRVYAEEIQEYLEEAATKQMYTVRAHINVMAAGTEAGIDAVKDKVTSAISKMGLTPVHDIHDVPVQFWASIPGNEAGLNYHEYMTLELGGALCMWLYDGFDKGIADGVLKMSDRQRLVPQRFDIQEKAMDEGLIENFNVFLLGPSGSGKSFFMNKYQGAVQDAMGFPYKAISNVLSWLISCIVDLTRCVLTLVSGMYLIVLGLLGPFVFALSIIPSFKGGIAGWLARYIQISFWMPICSIIDYINFNLKDKLLDVFAGNNMVEQMVFPTVFLIFLDVATLSMLLGVPKISAWIIASDGSGLGGSVASVAQKAARLFGKAKV